ncbi:hypothetical protein KY290_004906 [Solanum tuberosum]|uniref:Uncharacterized protein n=1 Tax=Solanum tuberosum TaxID=4113 RepID=A0ABQ7WCN0_SOLTU|nr:hypothetical protein KY284_005024 [Solanum tuberosum]KAH0778479.1 hypothetical protein KY290_004906 [Solanum tuberosum]
MTLKKTQKRIRKRTLKKTQKRIPEEDLEKDPEEEVGEDHMKVSETGSNIYDPRDRWVIYMSPEHGPEESP